jgi:hypothetical protein
MIATHMNGRLALTLVTTLFVMLICATGARAEEPYTGPVKEIASSVIGSEVNKATKGKICNILALEECQPGKLSTEPEPGGFRFTGGVAVNDDKASPQYGHVYVIDFSFRVQELAADGSFVSMFGWDVNRTKVGKGGATQQEMNVCTEAEIKAGGECQRGVEGSAPGQFGESQTSIAIDPASGTVYVTEEVKSETTGGVLTLGVRVQEFSAKGEWLGEIGKEVNLTKDGTPGATAEEKDICTQQEVNTKSVTCTGPAQYSFGSEPPANGTEPGVFPIGSEATVAAGGPEDLLYVGAGARIQEFAATSSSFKRQLPLEDPSTKKPTLARMIALDDSCQLQGLTEVTTPTCAHFDPSYGDLYVFYSESGGGTIIHKLGPNGVQLAEFPLRPRKLGATLFVRALAIDPLGRVLVSETEQEHGTSLAFGSLLDGATGRLITEFVPPNDTVPNALALNVSGDMYATAEQEVQVYTLVKVAALLASPAACVPGPEGQEADATLDCTLNGEANPEEVEGTKVFFQWGPAEAFGESTPIQIICTTLCGKLPVAVSPVIIRGVRPNQPLYDRLAGYDKNVIAPELLTSETASVTTPTVVPRIVGPPSASFVGSSSAVLSGELNPENAPTEYFFEYGTQLAGYCEGALRTGTLKSAVYGTIGATLEARGLQPATVYRYRLCGTDAAGSSSPPPPAGEFTTAPAPVPQALTGAYSALGTTSATIAGTVNSDGQPATYTFELGVENGAATQYVIVFSGPVEASTNPVEKTLALTGLQPGTTYAYHIAIRSGYGESTGATLKFTTEGLPEVIPVPGSLALLPVPPYKFPVDRPTPRTVKCKHGYKRNRHGKCVKIASTKAGKTHRGKARKARHAHAVRRRA